MHFGISAYQGCQHEGQDELNLTLNLSLAFLVQSSAAQHEAMVEVDMLQLSPPHGVHPKVTQWQCLEACMTLREAKDVEFSPCCR